MAWTPGFENTINMLFADIWRFPEFRGAILEVPIIRIILFWGLYWGLLYKETTIPSLRPGDPSPSEPKRESSFPGFRAQGL